MFHYVRSPFLNLQFFVFIIYNEDKEELTTKNRNKRKEILLYFIAGAARGEEIYSRGVFDCYSFFSRFFCAVDNISLMRFS